MIRFLATHAAAAARSRLFLCTLAAAFSLAFPLAPLRAAITATGDVEPTDPATWTDSTKAYVGNSGTGALTVDGGSSLLSQDACLGNEAGSSGTVTVTGAGSTWTSRSSRSAGVVSVGNEGTGVLNVTDGGVVNVGTELWIGVTGTVTVSGNGSAVNGPQSSVYVLGTLNVLQGGSVNSGSFVTVGADVGATTTVKVDGSGSTWNAGFNSISVGGGGTTNLSVTDGGSVSGCVLTGSSYGSNVFTVDGAGSNWSAINSMFDLGDAATAPAVVSLSLSGGGRMTTEFVPIASNSVLGIDVGKGSSLTLTGNATLGVGTTTVTNGTLTNNGTVRLLAAAGVPAGQQYSPITATTWNGTGTYQALGGTWDGTNHVFTVSNALSGSAGTQLTIDLENEQRVLFSDTGGRSVGVSFLSSTTSKPLSVTATTIGGSTFTALQSLLGPQQSILGGWEFAFTSGYTEGDPAYLSIGIGSGYSRNGLEVWHFDGSSWTPFSADDLTYDGTYASFTVTGFSGYAVTTVPEPSMLALLLAAAMGIFAYGRRKTT